MLFLIVSKKSPYTFKISPDSIIFKLETSAWLKTLLVFGIVLLVEQSEATAFINIFQWAPWPSPLALFSLLSFGVFCRSSGGNGAVKCPCDSPWPLPIHPTAPPPTVLHDILNLRFTLNGAMQEQQQTQQQKKRKKKSTTSGCKMKLLSRFKRLSCLSQCTPPWEGPFIPRPPCHTFCGCLPVLEIQLKTNFVYVKYISTIYLSGSSDADSVFPFAYFLGCLLCVFLSLVSCQG